MRYVELTENGRNWLQEHYPQGIVWEYDPDKPFKLLSWASEFIDITYLDIPHRIPPRARPLAHITCPCEWYAKHQICDRGGSS